jgi:hypothetical protein
MLYFAFACCHFSFCLLVCHVIMSKHAQALANKPGMPFLALEEEAHRQRGLDTRPSCPLPTTLGAAAVLQRRLTMKTM